VSPVERKKRGKEKEKKKPKKGRDDPTI